MIGRVLALDFDGVIWDSAPECYEVGWRVFLKEFGKDLSGEQQRQRFLMGRPLARTGHDFYLLFYLMATDPDLDLSTYPLESFLSLRNDHAEDASCFDREFYLLREAYREDDFEVWSSWQGPYPEVITLLDRLEKRFKGVALATTKDQASAHALLQTIHRDWPIWGKEFSTDKGEQILGIAQHYSISPQKITFIDDLLENLDQVAPTGAQGGLAAWGYNTEDLRAQASVQGYPVLDLLEIGPWLEGLLDEAKV